MLIQVSTHCILASGYSVNFHWLTLHILKIVSLGVARNWAVMRPVECSCFSLVLCVLHEYGVGEPQCPFSSLYSRHSGLVLGQNYQFSWVLNPVLIVMVFPHSVLSFMLVTVELCTFEIDWILLFFCAVKKIECYCFLCCEIDWISLFSCSGTVPLKGTSLLEMCFVHHIWRGQAE